VAKAFGVSIGYHPGAVEILRARLAQTGGEMNEARMRMARIPAGAELVLNKISAAPGFRIGNVIVMAGVPQIMQAMLDEAAAQLKTGAKMLSESVRADCREGDIGTELGAIAKAHPSVIIGSYPFMDEKRGANTHVVLRSRDGEKLAAAKAAVEAMLVRVHAQPAAG
jgi:molybdopterin-biosynthesis enzyme MoeA-like protein